LPSTFRALRHRNYRLYFCGQLISWTGTWVQTTALMWLAYDLTHESQWPGLISAAQILPTFFLGAWGGVLADRLPKRSLIFVTQAGMLTMALGLACAVFAGAASPWVLLAIALASGLVNAVDLPARLSFVVDMVGREDLVNAVALNSTVFNLARLFGPFLGGILLLAVGPAHCFLINALSYVAVLVALALMDIPGKPAVRKEHCDQSVRAAVGYILRRPGLALLLVLTGFVALCGWPFLSLLPALAEKRLAVPQLGYSLMLSGTGCGALLGSLTVATFGSLQRRRWFFSVGLTLVLSSMLGLSVAAVLPLAVGFCALIGCGMILFLATSQSVVQLRADDHNRSRILGVYSMILSGAMPLGNLLAGRAADIWGEAPVLRASVLVCGAAAAVVGVLYFLLTPWRQPP
jgi:MFS family permease